MNGERRNDIGIKVLLGALSLIVTTIMGFAIASSGKANDKAGINAIDIRGMKVAQERTREDIREMKSDVKEILKAVVK